MMTTKESLRLQLRAVEDVLRDENFGEGAFTAAEKVRRLMAERDNAFRAILPRLAEEILELPDDATKAEIADAVRQLAE